MKCFYHNADLDGKCSGAVVKMAYPDCDLFGINYGEPFPWDAITPGETVFMVDFSLQPFEDMDRLNTLCHLIWIDHHKTAIEEAERRGFRPSGGGSLEVGLAGCELAWCYLMSTPMPKAVHLLGRYDVWDHANHPGALEFQYGMKNEDCHPGNQRFWQEIFHDPTYVLEIMRTGELLLAYEDRLNEAYVRSCAFTTSLDGLKCLAINRGLTNSLVWKSVWDSNKYDAMLSFVFRKGKWTISLYTDRPGVDVGAVCKARGGGGHVGAAGFQCKDLPFALPEA